MNHVFGGTQPIADLLAFLRWLCIFPAIRMVILSAVFYFLAAHSVLAMPLLALLGVGIAAVLAKLRDRRTWFFLMIPFFLFSLANVFTGHLWNALFLNAFGTQGSAIIVHERETNVQLNDQYIWEYDAVLKTADNRDVAVHFNTMTASIYPIRNEILVPPANEVFIMKYIPGFERNIVIMSDESGHGKQLIIDQDKSPVEKAAGQYAISPKNPAFIKEYRDALKTFITKHRNDADPDLIEGYERELDQLANVAR